MLLMPFGSEAGQKLPDLKRQREIQSALTEKGYGTYKTWPETVVALKQIARQHHWQSSHAPDARVLILLGLGGPHSDPQVLDTPPSKLEPGLQAEYKRK